jgi:uncharacterized membrane protein
LFVLARKAKPEVLIERLRPFAGRCKMLQSSLSAENETILRKLFEGELSQAHPSTASASTSKS